MTIVIGDTGGTNAHYAQLVGGNRSNGYRHNIVIPAHYKARDFDTLNASMMAYVNTHVKGKVDCAIIDAAGPVLNVEGDPQVKFSNSPWSCSRAQLAKDLGLRPKQVKLINDFQAAAYAVKALDPAKDFIRIRGIPDLEQGPCVVIGPGTGLGTALLMPVMPDRNDKGFAAWAAEPQHYPATDINDHLHELIAAVKKIRGIKIVSHENLYCFGPDQGLVNLYHANRYLEKWEKRSFRLSNISPQDIVERSSTDKICRRAVWDFCFGLGLYAGQLALYPLADGGIYVLGVHEKLGNKFQAEAFLEGTLQNNKASLVERMPVSLVTAKTPAFKGLCYLAQKLKL